MHILWNDQIVEREGVKIDIEDRGYQYGDGLYEVIRVYNGQLYMAEEHLDRLWVGADKIHLHLPFTKEALQANLNQLIAVEGIQEGKLYFQVTRGIDSPRNHVLPDPQKVTAVLTGNLLPFDRPVKLMENGITATVIPDTRWLHCDIKSLSLLGNVLVLDEARKKGFDEAILVRDGKITETSASNFWMIKDDILYTHPDGNLVLPGITKMKILEIAKKLGLPVKEEAIDERKLALADECFTSSTLKEITPVVKVDEQFIGDGRPGEWTEKLCLAYIEEVNQVCGYPAK